MKILAIESSCDETAAAIIEDGRKILSSVIATQVEEHKLYGGVVPEIASRRHTESVSNVTSEALKNAKLTISDIDAFAVTYAPGLIGALLVGVNFAKGLAFSRQKPLVPVHHLRGHIAANYLTHSELKPPFLALVVSGGHSHIVKAKSYTEFEILGRTRDDAAGEALDKAARALGLPYPGGLNLDHEAVGGNPQAYTLPCPHVQGSPLDFSFSGLKTAVLNLIHNSEQRGETLPLNDVAASFQDAVTNELIDRFSKAAILTRDNTLVLAGGVSANSALRKKAQILCEKTEKHLFMPDLTLCGDNAAMIGAQAFYELKAGHVADISLNAYATMPIDKLDY